MFCPCCCLLALPFAVHAEHSSLQVLLALGALSMLGQGPLVAIVAMLIQSVTPAPMRARITALFFLLLNLLSAGLAPTAVAWASSSSFEGPRALGGGLSVVAGFGATGAALLFLSALAWSRKRLTAPI